MREYKRLGDAELEIMLIIWKAQEPVGSVYIHERLKKNRKWALSTLMSTLERLVKKGFVYCDRSTGNNLHYPLNPAILNIKEGINCEKGSSQKTKIKGKMKY